MTSDSFEQIDRELADVVRRMNALNAVKPSRDKHPVRYAEIEAQLQPLRTACIALNYRGIALNIAALSVSHAALATRGA